VPAATNVTTTIIRADNGSIRKPMWNAAPPLVIQVYRGPLKVLPFSTSARTAQDAAKDTIMHRIVTRCVVRGPISQPRNPAMIAPSRGARGREISSFMPMAVGRVQ
jgi:hypothetical protein